MHHQICVDDISSTSNFLKYWKVSSQEVPLYQKKHTQNGNICPLASLFTQNITASAWWGLVWTPRLNPHSKKITRAPDSIAKKLTKWNWSDSSPMIGSMFHHFLVNFWGKSNEKAISDTFGTHQLSWKLRPFEILEPHGEPKVSSNPICKDLKLLV